MTARKRHTEEQIIRILNEAEAGKSAKDICREFGISEKTFYVWRSKYGGMTVSDARKLKALEEENRKLKHMLADSLLENRALKEINSKNW
jgi:putative transposase